MGKALGLKDGTIIYTKDVKNLIVNGEEMKYSKETILEYLKKSATIGVTLIDGTIVNAKDIRDYYLFR